MAKSNRPVTLQDLSSGSWSRDASNSGALSRTVAAVSGSGTRQTTGIASSSYPAKSRSVPTYIIPSLPASEGAKELLDRVVGEFLPIISRRGYNVASISELCCCNDGLDFAPGRRRKLRKAADNIWGYNQTTTSRHGRFHTIHLRLRSVNGVPKHCRFLSYQDVAGTLAHELAHCEHGPHNDKFYKLMDEILEEHASLMVNNMSSHSNNAATNLGTAAAHTAPNQKLDPGRELGGDLQFKQWMTPREAAVAAAMLRQRQKELRSRGPLCCHFICEEADENEVWIDDESVEKPLKPVNDNKQMKASHAPKKRPRPTTNQNEKGVPSRLNGADIIDLTGDDDEGAAPVDTKRPHIPSKKASKRWNCKRCTYHNVGNATFCEMCLGSPP